MTSLEDRVTPGQPGAGGAGMIETVKRAVVLALRDAISGTSFNGLVNNSKVVIDMEYPLKKEAYPGIWVQFSFSKILRSGIGHELLLKTEEPGGRTNWEPVLELQFEGRVSLTIVALTSLERDRIADTVVSTLIFARAPERVITDPNRDTKQYRQLVDRLAKNPYVTMTINHDEVIPGGQATQTGAPWDEELATYEDTYSFDILGQTNITFRHDGTFTLRAVTDAGEMEPPPSPFDWQ
ncbi:hypothetical protein ET08_114 [Mycobacterium phage ET08]|uniref:Uncharacterized protein n=3 Tax=Bixzunavirus TaxID=680114 RepID=A0A1J0M9V2_9CAUD|nr:hypothetical protein ET08_114 [Mycobacterium phage ET08]YP_009597715.1 hypothetical protein FDH18_gp183 [Mycobacterium phage Lukilu]ACU41643.1 hypothetical protein LRRHOOD_119 [Mycobacterium phage LRRHood]ATN90083.1 hypothetical protein SEA_KOGUMA_123 [Mycobacterium phage Koguma]QAY13411.1 hypothetical protein SEA_SPRINKLERS_122 [Mycobacterium phage Sprinklers]QDP44479.1 hypothetical protein SEA_GRUNGLE_113 [Mycobacterium phage Grungle]ACU41357.1 hypothetical protein ET08_114 [Mycobacteriu